MSHEIRTPLNSIVGFSNLLASEKDLDEADKLLFVHDGRGQEDLVAPDNGNGGGDRGHVHRPFHAFSAAELRRQVLFRAGTVLVGAAPVRPVFSMHEGGCEDKKSGGGETFHERMTKKLITGKPVEMFRGTMEAPRPPRIVT